MRNRVDIYEVISQNIKYNRKKLRLTQLKVAEISGFSHEFIRRIEAKGCKKYFSVGTVYEISLALDIDMVELVKVNNKENDGGMFNDELSFFENSKMEFHTFLSNISLELSKKDTDYKRVEIDNRIILKKYPKISDILEEKEVDSLNKDECNALATYLDNTLFLKYKELEEIYFKGFKEAYFYFSKCNLLKNNEKLEETKGNTN